MFVHFDRDQTLSIDVDSSKVGDIGAVIYNVEGALPGPKERFWTPFSTHSQRIGWECATGSDSPKASISKVAMQAVLGRETLAADPTHMAFPLRSQVLWASRN